MENPHHIYILIHTDLRIDVDYFAYLTYILIHILIYTGYFAYSTYGLFTYINKYVLCILLALQGTQVQKLESTFLRRPAIWNPRNISVAVFPWCKNHCEEILPAMLSWSRQ